MERKSKRQSSISDPEIQKAHANNKTMTRNAKIFLQVSNFLLVWMASYLVPGHTTWPAMMIFCLGEVLLISMIFVLIMMAIFSYFLDSRYLGIGIGLWYFAIVVIIGSYVCFKV